MIDTLNESPVLYIMHNITYNTCIAYCLVALLIAHRYNELRINIYR